MSRRDDPKSLTFKTLAESASTEASDALLAALNSGDKPCRCLASQAIIEHRSQLTILNLIREVDTLRDDVCVALSREPERFTAPLRQCFQRGDKYELRNAIEFVRRCGCIGHFSDVLAQLEHWDGDIRDVASIAIRHQAEELAMRLLTDDSSYLPGIDFDHARVLRIELLSELSRSIFQFDRLMNPVPAIDAILILGRPDEEEVKSVCSKYGADCKEIVAESLLTLKSRPIFETICEAQKLLAPMPVFTDALSKRDDQEFVLSLLTWMPRRITSCLEANIKRAGALPWLTTEHPTLQQIPPSLHDRLIALLNCTSLERDDKNDIKKWVVRHSSGSGRAAASDVLNWLPHKEVQHILYNALVDADNDVEAWATQQLRSQKVPDTFQHLLQRLDSERPQVRDAAREELASFNVERVFDLFESLPQSTCHRCGQLLQKINPHVLDEFREELSHAFHWRRVRATRAIGELGLVDELLPSLTVLLEEPEWSVRRAVIEALSKSDSPAALQVISSMAGDEQRQVREAVREALHRIEQRQRPTEQTLAAEPSA
ncbi:hypothetical protein GC176_24075 [bacterium]|nr:hypothetical protein [bacterium]